MIFKNKVAIVTGGASGIGLALAKELRHRGAIVVIVDVQDDVKRVASELEIESAVVDVCDAAGMQEMVSQVVEGHGRLDYMFNNAGVLVSGKFQNTSLEDWERVFDVNVKGVLNGAKAVYPLFMDQGFGHIVNTASIAGLIPCPGLIAYSASKHAVVGLSTGLRAEAQRYGVNVSVVCPGFVKTNIMENGTARDGIQEKLVKSVPWANVDEVVHDILDGVAKNRAVIVVTRHGKILNQLNRLAPRASQWAQRALSSLRR